MYKQIGILTGGGDAPGLNAAIRAVVRTAINEYGMSCVGIEDSFEGVLGETHTRKLTVKSVSGILHSGGTILGTRNRGSFVKVANGKSYFPELPIGEALANLDILEIEALVVIGGEGTLALAQEFHKRGFPIVGVPKTIDNDLAATEFTFGFMRSSVVFMLKIPRIILCLRPAPSLDCAFLKVPACAMTGAFTRVLRSRSIMTR